MKALRQSLVSYYDQNNCIPVNQQGTVHDRKYARDYLYNSLGLNSFALKDLRVCEVGPGTSQNAIDLSRRGIRQLSLIEPSQAGQITCSKLEREGSFGCPVTIFSGSIEDFNPHTSTQETFDLVITEGLVGSSGYDDPFSLFDSIAKLVRPEGYLMVGCEDDTGWFPEMLRRFISLVLCKQSYRRILSNVDACVELLESYLNRSHETLNFKTRRISSDIIIDNILSPVLDKPFLGPLQIISSRPSLKFVSSSPSFNVTPTYYKEAAVDPSFASNKFILEYTRMSLYVLDCKVVEGHLLTYEEGLKLVHLISSATASLKKASAQLLTSDGFVSASLLHELSSWIKSLNNLLAKLSFKRTSILHEFVDLLDSLVINSNSADSLRLTKRLLELEVFASWYGRTQTSLLLQSTE
jgi:hypothetical protein